MPPNDPPETQYQNPHTCNKCGGDNNVHGDPYEGEVKTTCLSCGWCDYWAYGFFESGAEIESKADTYVQGDAKYTL